MTQRQAIAAAVPARNKQVLEDKHLVLSARLEGQGSEGRVLDQDRLKGGYGGFVGWRREGHLEEVRGDRGPQLQVSTSG